MKRPSVPLHPAFAHADPAECAIDKGRLYGIATFPEMAGFDACARDVSTAADWIEAVRRQRAH